MWLYYTKQKPYFSFINDNTIEQIKKERAVICVCVSVSASRSRSWTVQGTSHVNYLVIKTYKLAEQTGSYTPNATQEEYGSTIDAIIRTSPILSGPIIRYSWFIPWIIWKDYSLQHVALGNHMMVTENKSIR